MLILGEFFYRVLVGLIKYCFIDVLKLIGLIFKLYDRICIFISINWELVLKLILNKGDFLESRFCDNNLFKNNMDYDLNLYGE